MDAKTTTSTGSDIPALVQPHLARAMQLAMEDAISERNVQTSTWIADFCEIRHVPLSKCYLLLESLATSPRIHHQLAHRWQASLTPHEQGKLCAARRLQSSMTG